MRWMVGVCFYIVKTRDHMDLVKSRSPCLNGIAILVGLKHHRELQSLGAPEAWVWNPGIPLAYGWYCHHAWKSKQDYTQCGKNSSHRKFKSSFPSEEKGMLGCHKQQTSITDEYTIIIIIVNICYYSLLFLEQHFRHYSRNFLYFNSFHLQNNTMRKIILLYIFSTKKKQKYRE